ncbi:MAG: DUF4389 domain-containing protein [Hyphomicrobiaceae bacterium]|nr:DUF4389 domain-containing protein [Hyphomicrobiaceae bacterium]
MRDVSLPSHPRPVWRRGLLMLLFLAAFAIAHTLLNVIALVQIVWLLVSGASNPYIAGFGRSLALWLAAAAAFLSCADEAMPFPMQSWPGSV